MAELKYDAENGSTIFTSQAVVKKIVHLLEVLLQHVIIETPNLQQRIAQPPPRPVAPPAPVYQQPVYAQPMQAPVGYPAPVQHFPGLQPQVQVAPPAFHPGYAGGLNNFGPSGAPSNVTEVMITPTETRVIPPAGQPIVVPPGYPVDTVAFGTAQVAPTVPGPAIEGEIILPKGGGMTAEVIAAINAAKNAGNAPIFDASGGARNITHDPMP
jgi:hypothetical protein